MGDRVRDRVRDKASATVVASFNPILANSISAIYVHLTGTLATLLPHNAGRRVASKWDSARQVLHSTPKQEGIVQGRTPCTALWAEC